MKDIQLYDFNNLTKTLSFNIYDVSYAITQEDKKKYIEYIDEEYNSKRLTQILTNITKMIGANLLNIAKQDYYPQGASVNLLITEEPLKGIDVDSSCNMGSVLGHLDKSHISIHTYPESHPDEGIMTFRVDLDVSTCGMISPLKALDYLFDVFECDIVICDYRVRGFTRDMKGKKYFKDHKISSIQDYINTENKNRYHSVDVNVYQENIFHTKMILKHLELDNYIFEKNADDLDRKEREDIMQKLNKEMIEIYYGRNTDE